MFNPRTIIHKTIDTESSTESILSLMNSNKNLCSMLSQSVEEVSIINFSIQDSRSNGYTPEASELPQAAENKVCNCNII